MKTLLFAAALSSLALAACGEKAKETQVSEPAADGITADGMTADGKATMNGMGGTTASSISAASDPQEYATQAASSDQFEIQTGQLALAQSKNPAVRDFAQQMIDDHRASTRLLQVAATSAALQAPRLELLAAHQARLIELQGAGANFDELYLQQQREAHAEAIALHQTMMGNAAAPAQLSSFANDVLPTVQEHAKRIETIKLPLATNN